MTKIFAAILILFIFATNSYSVIKREYWEAIYEGCVDGFSDNYSPTDSRVMKFCRCQANIFRDNFDDGSLEKLAEDETKYLETLTMYSKLCVFKLKIFNERFK